MIAPPDSRLSGEDAWVGKVMAHIYAPIVRALVVVALVLATATLMLVAVNTVRAADRLPFAGIHLNR